MAYKEQEQNKAIQILETVRKIRQKEEKERKIWSRCEEYVSNWVDGELGQWRQEARDQTGKDKPTLSFNEIRKFVNRISGAQVSAKVDQKVWPRDDESDPVIAEILSDLLKYVADVNHAEWHVNRAFRDMIITGRGFIKHEWSDELDPLGEVTISRVNPHRVFLIGNGERYDLTDRKGIVELLPMTREDLVSLYPDFEEQINGLSEVYAEDLPVGGTDYYFGEKGYKIDAEDVYDKDDKTLKVYRCQKYEYVPVKYIEDPQTGKLTEAPERGLDTVLQIIGQQFGVQPRVIDKKIKRVRVITSVGDIVLKDELSPYRHNKLDIIPLFAYMDGGKITGVIQDLLDAQDEKNKRRSQITYMMLIAPKGNYFYTEGTFADPEDAQKRMGGVGQLIPVQGTTKDKLQPVQSDLTVIPALTALDAAATAEMKEISGLHDAALGEVPQGVKSGRGIQSLQGPSETIISELYNNYLFSMKLGAEIDISLMQQFYTTERRVRILGDYTSKFVPEGDKLQQMMQAGLMSFQDGQKIITINKQQGEQKLNDISVGRYDVIVDNVSHNATTRRALLYDLQNMRAMGIPIPNTTIIEYSDIKNKQKVIAEMQNEMMMLAQQMAQQQIQESTQRSASPKNPVPMDILGNVAGGQLP